MSLRALTVRQPYAGAIIWHGKDRENRPRPMRYRGLLLIHAGLHVPPWHDFLGVRDMASRPPEWDDDRRARGVLLGTVQVSGCHHARDCYDGSQQERRRRHCSPWAVSGQWHIELSEPRPLAKAVPCKGSLATPWRLPEDVEKAVRAQLEIEGQRP